MSTGCWAARGRRSRSLVHDDVVKELSMTTMIDVEQELKRLYRAGGSPELVDVPELSFLMIDGRGDPNSSARFQEAVQALYGVSYTLKSAFKRAGEPDYRVAPLEGLW